MNQEYVEYLDYLKSLNYSQRTIKGIAHNLKSFKIFMKESIGVEKVEEISKNNLALWRKSLISRTNKDGLPIKPSTVNKNIANVKCFLRWLAKQGLVSKVLEESIEYVIEPKMLPLPSIEHSKIKKAFEKIDTSTVEGYRDRTILELMYSSGLRASEITGLDVSSVDLKNGTIKVFGKFRKERMVPIGKTALRHLETYLKAIRPFLAVGDEQEALFLNVKKPTRLHYKRLLNLVHKHFDDITDINPTPHTFRRSCASSLIRGNANLAHLKDLMGWESMDTVSTYTKMTVIDLKKTLLKCHPREKDEK